MSISCPGCGLTDIGPAIAQAQRSCPECGERWELLASVIQVPLQAYLEGLEFARAGLDELALERLAAAATMRPGEARFLVALGKAWVRQGNLVRAIELFGEARRIDPKMKSAVSALEVVRGMLDDAHANEERPVSG